MVPSCHTSEDDDDEDDGATRIHVTTHDGSLGEASLSVTLLAAHGVQPHSGDPPMDDPGNVRSLSPEQGKSGERSGGHAHRHALLW